MNQPTQLGSMERITPHQSLEMPLLGFGTWRLWGEECRKAVIHALSVGYRHIDTAEMYENEKEIGEAIRENHIAREELFLTSKVWVENLWHDAVKKACKRSLRRLGTDYLDLYLIHWPDRSIPIEEPLGALAELQQEGKIRALGVSNFTIRHLKDALETGIPIANNQVEFHPSFNQTELQVFCEETGIWLTAYMPIGRGKDLQLPAVKAVAEKCDRPPSQVILQWLMQKKIAAIPKATTAEHIDDNFAATQWELAPEDVRYIDENVRERKRLLNPWVADFEYQLWSELSP